jgi:RNA polymerase sigma-70 factor, ECF subfamily
MPDLHADVFSKLFAESHAALRGYIRRLVRSHDTADEIVQEAFLRTYVHAECSKAPKAFLYSIARNLATDHLRHDRIAQTETLGDLDVSNVVSEEVSLEADLLANERAHLLVEAVKRLAPQCRAVFTLKVFHDCSYKEISERLGLSTKTVEHYFARGVRETRNQLRRRFRDCVL